MDIKNLLKKTEFGNNSFLLLIVLIGVVFMLFSNDGEGKKYDNKKDTDEKLTVNDEEKLKEILSEIKGVGQVSVMVTYDSGIETDIAYDTDSRITKKGDGVNSTDNDENIKKQAVMKSGEPIVLKYIYPKVKGIIVAAQGAYEPSVRQNIIDAVTAAMGIPPHRVCIVERKN